MKKPTHTRPLVLDGVMKDVPGRPEPCRDMPGELGEDDDDEALLQAVIEQIRRTVPQDDFVPTRSLFKGL